MSSESTIKRSTFLKAAVGAGALLAAPGIASSVIASTRTASSAPGAATARGVVAGPSAVFTNKVADLTGPGLTDRFRMAATDLGIPVRTPDGRMLFMLGDTFENPVVGGGWWPVPVPHLGRGQRRVRLRLLDRFPAEQADHPQTSPQRPARQPGGVRALGVPRRRLELGQPGNPILTGSFGELCLRPLGGKWVLTWFNAGDYRIDGIIMDTPTSNLYTAYRQTLIYGGAWSQENDNHVAQLYGGYIIPGSTLSDLHLSVSQWKTDTGWPYRVMQFRIRNFG